MSQHPHTLIRNAFAPVALCVALALLLVACSPMPVEPGSERLDEGTGTTFTVMPRPIELVAERAPTPGGDPFAYLAPFQTNRMGHHELFLWVAAPQTAGPLATPRIWCEQEQLQLHPLEATLRDIGLSNAPYKPPAPWSTQWYFRLTREDLDCLTHARQLHIETEAADQQTARYSTDASALAALNAFVAQLPL
jgi:hypothetical protein